MQMLRANTSAVLTVPELEAQIGVREGMTYDVDTSPWSETRAAHPWVFDDPADVADVEAASANPGEKRSTRRVAK